MDLFQAVILGLIQGVTSWLPVSSKTQVLLFGTLLFNLPFHDLLSFALIVHIGDLLALFVMFKKEYISLLKVRPKTSDLKNFAILDGDKKLAYYVIFSVIATAIIALPLYLLVRHSLSELSGTLFLFFTGVMLLAMSVISKASGSKSQPAKLTVKSAALTGAAQGLAVLPGISRSGITSSSLLLQGVKQDEAIKLAFIIGTPMIILALIVFQFTDGYTGLTLPIVVAGIAVSMITSYVTMNVMLKIAQRVKFYWFTIAFALLAMTPLAIQLLFPFLN